MCTTKDYRLARTAYEAWATEYSKHVADVAPYLAWADAPDEEKAAWAGVVVALRRALFEPCEYGEQEPITRRDYTGTVPVDPRLMAVAKRKPLWPEPGALEPVTIDVIDMDIRDMPRARQTPTVGRGPGEDEER